MEVAVHPASLSDLPELLRLYRGLEQEMRGLHHMWPQADGLPEPVVRSLESAIDDPEGVLLIGSIDGAAVGLLLARVEPLLDGGAVGAIRLVYVEPEAREVGVGESLRESALEELRGRGLRRFDAHVLPGHRAAKNFFEQGGFAARSIVMHHSDD